MLSEQTDVHLSSLLSFIDYTEAFLISWRTWNGKKTWFTWKRYSNNLYWEQIACKPIEKSWQFTNNKAKESLESSDCVCSEETWY